MIQGLADATVAHDEAWQFLSLGKYLERADNVSRLLRVQSPSAHERRLAEPGDDTVRWLAVLRSAGSAEAYSRYYSLRVEPTRVLEFLLLNPTFPQSVRYSLGAAWSALESIARATDDSAGPPVRALGLLQARLEHASVDEVIEFGLEEFLTGIQDDIAQRLRTRDARVFPLLRRRPVGTSPSPRAAPRSWPPSSNNNENRRHPRHSPGLRRRSQRIGHGYPPRPARRRRPARRSASSCAWSRPVMCVATKTASATLPTC